MKKTGRKSGLLLDLLDNLVDFHHIDAPLSLVITLGPSYVLSDTHRMKLCST